ncbi:MAG TPA: hypothetical protein EYH17_02925 [Pyrodictium sp.]|nr:hypothetical protein [Pyrodictium sp.]
MNEKKSKAKKALIKALAYVNVVMIPLFVLGVLLFLEYRWQVVGLAGLVLAATSPFIAYLIVYVAIKKRVVKINL